MSATPASRRVTWRASGTTKRSACRRASGATHREGGRQVSVTQQLQARFEAALMGTYGVPPVALVRGEGCRVWDAEGNQYTDLIAGIAVSSLGHAHPAVTGAVTRQVHAIAHTSNLFLHEGEIALAERLLALLAADGRVFFTNSGTEANEAALKLVRRHQGPSTRGGSMAGSSRSGPRWTPRLPTRETTRSAIPSEAENPVDRIAAAWIRRGSAADGPIR